ncbi:MAG: sigma-70 family RNA polymerase sigma factor [Elusimicrobia bacterium]|nr:sigma-70 family RNA polymerase sigma factor [Elusimicrobiota bacterium]
MVNEIGQEPLLNAQEERELGKLVQAAKRARAELARRGGDPELQPELQPLIETMKAGEAARQRFVRANLLLVVDAAAEFSGRGATFDELFEAAMPGLISAVDGFDPNRGNRFSTYAVPAITKRMQGGFLKNQALTVPSYMQTVIKRVQGVRTRLEGSLGRPATDEELRDASGLGESQFSGYQKALLAKPAALPRFEGKEDERAIERLADETSGDVGDAVDLQNQRALFLSLIESQEQKGGKHALRARVVKMRFEGMTLEDIGRNFNWSREWVRQIEAAGMKELAGLLGAHGGQAFASVAQARGRKSVLRQRLLLEPPSSPEPVSPQIEEYFNGLIADSSAGQELAPWREVKLRHRGNEAGAIPLDAINRLYTLRLLSRWEDRLPQAAQEAGVSIATVFKWASKWKPQALNKKGEERLRNERLAKDLVWMDTLAQKHQQYLALAQSGRKPAQTLDEFLRDYFIQVLSAAQGIRVVAMKVLDIPKHRFFSLLREYRVDTQPVP